MAPDPVPPRPTPGRGDLAVGSVRVQGIFWTRPTPASYFPRLPAEGPQVVGSRYEPAMVAPPSSRIQSYWIQ